MKMLEMLFMKYASRQKRLEYRVSNYNITRMAHLPQEMNTKNPEVNILVCA